MSRKVQQRLREAQEEHHLVVLERGAQRDDLEGYVVGVGREWTLLGLLSDQITLDGYVAVRTREIRRVRRPGRGEMCRRTLELRGQWPPVPPAAPIDLDDTRELLFDLGVQYPVITVHLEDDDPEVCFVGAVAKVGRKKLHLREITPRGVWTARPSRHRLEGITRIDMGGGYEEALVLVAGDPPELGA